MLFVAVAAAFLPSYALAQTVYTVNVAENGLSFTPSNINGVNNGDVVQFVFNAAGHTVTQSTLAVPCTPLDGGFSSGLSAGAGEVWNLTVSDTSRPIWYFCARNSPTVHCEQGMVGAINSPDVAFNSFSANAKAATNTPTATSVILTGSGAAATAELATASAISGAAPSGSAAGSGSTSSSRTSSGTSSAAPSQSSSAAMPFAGFEGIGASVLALFGALLF